MSEKTKKIISVVLNIIMVILFFVFTLQSKLSYSLIGSWGEEITKWLAYASVYIGMTLPLVTLLSIVLSVSYRNEEAYTKSIVIQFLPFAVYALTIVFSFLSQI